MNTKPKEREWGCKDQTCSSSTGIHDELTFGKGKLADDGYWEIPCYECARAFEKLHPEYIACWPFPLAVNRAKTNSIPNLKNAREIYLIQKAGSCTQRVYVYVEHHVIEAFDAGWNARGERPIRAPLMPDTLFDEVTRERDVYREALESIYYGHIDHEEIAEKALDAGLKLKR